VQYPISNGSSLKITVLVPTMLLLPRPASGTWDMRLQLHCCLPGNYIHFLTIKVQEKKGLKFLWIVERYSSNEDRGELPFWVSNWHKDHHSFFEFRPPSGCSESDSKEMYQSVHTDDAKTLTTHGWRVTRVSQVTTIQSSEDDLRSRENQRAIHSSAKDLMESVPEDIRKARHSVFATTAVDTV
jgi:hypothetical protein